MTADDDQLRSEGADGAEPEGLEPPDAARAEALTAAFARLGIDDPAAHVRSEIDDDTPELARLTLLRAVWRHIEQWRDIDTVPGLAGVATDKQIALAARVGARAAFDLALAILDLLDDERDTDMPAGPGWGLVERGADGRATGRVLNRLHDTFLDADPRGIQAADILDP
jgi:hypothetical protein